MKKRIGSYLCAVLVRTDRDQVFRTLRDRGVGVGTRYPPNHQQPAFASWHRSLPVTERVGRQIMTRSPPSSLPSSAGTQSR